MNRLTVKPRAKRINRDDIAQRAVLDWLRVTYHAVWEMTFHVPNGCVAAPSEREREYFDIACRRIDDASDKGC